jgi:hypothetical protein
MVNHTSLELSLRSSSLLLGLLLLSVPPAGSEEE